MLTVHSVIVFAFTVTSLFLFHMRKRAFVKTFLIYQVYLILANAVLLVKDLHQQFGVGHVLFAYIPAYVEAALIIGYLIRSKRVKNTFVR